MLQHLTDSLFLLVLESPPLHGESQKGAGGRDIWRLPYPTYAFATGDVNGDGKTDALVGVIKRTRFDAQPARRLFVFQQTHGRIRPLWLGSRLTGQLQDFRFEDGQVITLEQDADSLWFVGCYNWDHFGFVQTSTRIHKASHAAAAREFYRETTCR